MTPHIAIIVGSMQK